MPGSAQVLEYGAAGPLMGCAVRRWRLLLIFLPGVTVWLVPNYVTAVQCGKLHYLRVKRLTVNSTERRYMVA